MASVISELRRSAKRICFQSAYLEYRIFRHYGNERYAPPVAGVYTPRDDTAIIDPWW